MVEPEISWDLDEISQDLDWDLMRLVEISRDLGWDLTRFSPVSYDVWLKKEMSFLFLFLGGCVVNTDSLNVFNAWKSLCALLSYLGAHCFSLLLLPSSFCHSGLVWINVHQALSFWIQCSLITLSSPRMLQYQGFRCETACFFLYIMPGSISKTGDDGRFVHFWHVPSLPT